MPGLLVDGRLHGAEVATEVDILVVVFVKPAVKALGDFGSDVIDEKTIFEISLAQT